MPLRRVLPSSGRSVVRVDNGALWLAGTGASPSGDRPFLDRWELATRKPVRVFQAGESHFERVFALLGSAAPGEPARIVTSGESLAEPSNLVLRSGDGMARMQPLTAHADPTPSRRGIQRVRVRFKRADGADLSFRLYLPTGHKGKNAGDARPTFVWAYPEEFTDSSVAGQVSGNRNRFLSFGATNPLMLLLKGYVVLMDATMPVVGDPKTVNDSFIEQIGANARAIVEQAVALGVTQRDKVVVVGHSYGAVMVADRIKAPVLLIHGESDDNPGSFPLQSQRLYQALAGTGGNVRYMSLPFEGHGYSARESQGHVLWEMAEWMRRHAGPAVAP